MCIDFGVNGDQLCILDNKCQQENEDRKKKRGQRQRCEMKHEQQAAKNTKKDGIEEIRRRRL